MKTKIFTTIILIILGFSLSQEFKEEEGVIVLEEDNFDQAIKQYEYLLVEFYAPWCGHCKKLEPEYARAAQILAKEIPPLFLGKIDVTVHKGLALRFNVEGFPTLKLFIKGEPLDYNGGRTESEIVSWMKKKTGPASKSLNTIEEVENFKNSADVSIILFGDESDEYLRVARTNQEIIFGQCSTQECFDNYKVNKGTVVLFKKFDEGRNDYTSEITEESLSQFVNANSSPSIMKFDEKCAQLIFGKATPGLFLYRDVNSAETSHLDNILQSVANKIRGKIQVIITDIKEGLEVRLAEYIGITSEDLPSVRIHDTRVDLKKFNMVGPITEENIMKFVQDWEQGKLKAHLKSEEIPESQNDDVYTLVGKNFDQIVMDPTKDVLVEFYAPWCGHCKKLAPIYEEVANKLKSNPNLIIAKMDSIANEIETVSVQGYPTIKFWPANNKSNPIDFNGERTVEGFIKFLTENSSNSVEVKDDL